MFAIRQVFAKAGSLVSLPFILWAAVLLQCDVGLAKEEVVLTFQEFQSSCIDLGQYDAKARQLTVRFVNRNSERFYRYSNIPAEIWNKLKALNNTGGVGEYLNETVVQHREKFPFEELTIRKFKTVPKMKKAGDSK